VQTVEKAVSSFNDDGVRGAKGGDFIRASNDGGVGGVVCHISEWQGFTVIVGSSGSTLARGESINSR